MTPKEMAKRIEKGERFKPVNDLVSRLQWAVCKEHGKLEQFEPDELGLDFYQAIGECSCGRPTFYENGEPTKITVNFEYNDG